MVAAAEEAGAAAGSVDEGGAALAAVEEAAEVEGAEGSVAAAVVEDLEEEADFDVHPAAVYDLFVCKYFH